MFERILIPIDFSLPSRWAMHCGNQLAERCNSETFVVHVLTFLANKEEASKHLVPGADWFTVFRKELDEFVQGEPYSPRSLNVLVHDDATSEILKYSQEHDCNLIVAGSHGHSTFMNTLLGSVTQKLMRHSNIPLMTVPASMSTDRELKFENILVPIDFSPISLKALRLGARMAQNWNSTLHLMHVVDMKTIWDTQKITLSQTVSMADLDVTPNLKQLLKQMEFTGSSIVSTLYGNPDEEILQYAREHNSDFIVMGCHGRKGLDRVLIGSTTVSVIRHAQVPIITFCEQFQAGQEQENV